MIEALMRGRLQHMRFCKASPCSVSWCDRSSLSTIVTVVVATDEMDVDVRQEPANTEGAIEKHIIVDGLDYGAYCELPPSKNIYYSLSRHEAKEIKEETDNKDEGAKEDKHAAPRHNRVSSPTSVLEASTDLSAEVIVETFCPHDSNNKVASTCNLDTCSCSRLPLKKRPFRNSFVKDMKKRTKIN